MSSLKLPVRVTKTVEEIASTFPGASKTVSEISGIMPAIKEQITIELVPTEDVRDSDGRTWGSAVPIDQAPRKLLPRGRPARLVEVMNLLDQYPDLLHNLWIVCIDQNLTTKVRGKIADGAKEFDRQCVLLVSQGGWGEEPKTIRFSVTTLLGNCSEMYHYPIVPYEH